MSILRINIEPSARVQEHVLERHAAVDCCAYRAFSTRPWKTFANLQRVSLSLLGERWLTATKRDGESQRLTPTARSAHDQSGGEGKRVDIATNQRGGKNQTANHLRHSRHQRRREQKPTINSSPSPGYLCKAKHETPQQRSVKIVKSKTQGKQCAVL